MSEDKERSLREELQHAFSTADGQEIKAGDELQTGDRYVDDEYNIGTGRGTDQGNSGDSGDDSGQKAGDGDKDDDADKYEDNRADAAKTGEGDDDKPPGSIDAPVKWTKEEKEAFELANAFGDDAKEWAAKLQSIIHTRNKGIEGEFTKRMQSMAQERKQYQDFAQRYGELEKVLAPRRQQWARDGVNDVAAINQLLALNDHAVAQPVDFLKWFMNGRGITPEQLGIDTQGKTERVVQVIDQEGNTVAQYVEDGGQGGQQQQTQQQAPQFNVQQSPEYQALQAKLQKIEEAQNAEAQRIAQQQAQSANATVEQFAAQTDANGNLLYPHFNDVRAAMSQLITMDPTLTLENAYNAAVAANPTLRQQQMESHELRLRREQEARNRAASAQSRQAAASLPTGASTGAPPPSTDRSNLSLREQLMAGWDDAMKQGRVT